ncbi:MAG TPA: hypothetical protein VG167_19005 [Verrucomicrobiae bacterium]|nr:hypothetical protein [Verrucomicrobiae bacterium]
MNKIKVSFLSASVALAVLYSGLVATVATSLTGCSSAPRVAYQAAATTQVSVDTAMNLWGAYVAAVHPPVSQEQAVATAYAKYQYSMAALCDAGAVYAAYSVTNASGATGAQAALQEAMATLSQSITDLESLIAGFGVNLHAPAPAAANQFTPLPLK